MCGWWNCNVEQNTDSIGPAALNSISSSSSSGLNRKASALSSLGTRRKNPNSKWARSECNSINRKSTVDFTVLALITITLTAHLHVMHLQGSKYVVPDEDRTHYLVVFGLAAQAC